MQSSTQESILSVTQKLIILLFIILIISSLFFFRNILFKPTFLLKSFGEVSVDPELAFNNNKPTFLEFYAEWCEVCKEMAPKVSSFREEYENEINFVFLNVDNQKWENYIRKFNVNGIPQINLFNKNGDLEATFIGKQEEKNIQKVLDNLNRGIESNNDIVISSSSAIKDKKAYKVNPRSHG